MIQSQTDSLSEGLQGTQVIRMLRRQRLRVPNFKRTGASSVESVEAVPKRTCLLKTLSKFLSLMQSVRVLVGSVPVAPLAQEPLADLDTIVGISIRRQLPDNLPAS